MKFFFFSIFFSIFFFSCTSKNEKFTFKDRFTNFVNKDSTIVLFGKIDITSLINKSQIKKTPKLGLILSSILTDFDHVVNLKSDVYFALKGPFDTNAIPSIFYVFFNVKNADSLVFNLTKKGYDFDKKNNLQFSQFGKFSLGIEDNLGIVMFNTDEYNSYETLSLAFEKTHFKSHKVIVNKMISSKGDILASINLDALYSTSNTNLKKLNFNKRKEIKTLVKNSYINTSINFTNDEIYIDSRNYFSDKLNDKLFFKSDTSALILTKLGIGSPRFGLAMNLDITKFQQFMDCYAPYAISDICEKFGDPFETAVMMAGKNSLSGLFSGEFGFVLIGTPQVNGTIIPDFNIFLGLGENGIPLAKMAQSFLSNSLLKTSINSHGIFCSSTNNGNNSTSNNMILPFCAKSFGKKSITSFIDFNGMDFSSFELEGFSKLLNIVRYISFELDSNGFQFHVKAIESNNNILSQSLFYLLREYESKLSELSF